MALAKIKFTNKETKKTQTMQKTFSNRSDAEFWQRRLGKNRLVAFTTKEDY